MVKAAILEDVRKLKIVDYPEPKVEDNGILLKMELCGVCGTDMHLYEGNMKIPFPVIPGHEWVGVIEEIGEKAKGYESRGLPLDVGDRITVVPGTNRYCGECYFCKFIQFVLLITKLTFDIFINVRIVFIFIVVINYPFWLFIIKKMNSLP